MTHIRSIIKKERFYCKRFDKNKLATWYSEEVQKKVDSRVNFKDVNVERRLSVLKQIQGIWSVEVYNFFTSAQGKVYVLQGRKKAGIKGVVNEREVLPPFDPYQGIFTDNS